MRIIQRRDVIRSVPEKFNEQYRGSADDRLIGIGDGRRTVGSIREALAQLDLETCSAADIGVAMGQPGSGWAVNRCNECGEDSPILIHIGDDPDYEAQWQDLCLDCLKRALKSLKATPILP